MANSVDPDETPRSAASHLGLHCLLRPVYPNTYGKSGTVKRKILLAGECTVYLQKTECPGQTATAESGLGPRCSQNDIRAILARCTSS